MPADHCALSGVACAGVAFVLVAIGTVVACGARTPLPTPDACEALDDDLEPVTADLDMHLLLDSSGSMIDLTPDGIPKWEAIVGALQVFFDSPDAAGLGVGLSCFPVLDPNVPEACTGNDSACGVPGACLKLGACLDSGTACELTVGCTDEEFPDEACTPIGFCELAPDVFCAPSAGLDCLPEEGGCLEYGICENRSTCDVGAYTTPIVPLQTLPSVGTGALFSAMYERVPEGGTTTLPALVGIHQQALAGAAERPERRHVVVLATDGFPTACDPSLEGILGSEDDDVAIRHLADVAADAAASGQRTFVVGVFTQEEAADARANLDAIARAGGTERAFLVGAQGALTEDFARALEEARVSATACEYALPTDLGNADLELAAITVESAGGERAVELLPSASACTDGRAGAYEVEGASPTLVLCPSICAAVLEEGLPPIHVRGGCVREEPE